MHLIYLHGMWRLRALSAWWAKPKKLCRRVFLVISIPFATACSELISAALQYCKSLVLAWAVDVQSQGSGGANVWQGWGRLIYRRHLGHCHWSQNLTLILFQQRRVVSAVVVVNRVYSQYYSDIPYVYCMYMLVAVVCCAFLPLEFVRWMGDLAMILPPEVSQQIHVYFHTGVLSSPRYGFYQHDTVRT